MTVQAGPPYKRYAANGIAPAYTIPFLVINASDLLVTLNGAVVTSGFTLTGLGNPTSTATFTVPPLGDLLFQLNIPIQRLTDYQTNGDMLAKTVNLDFDRLWLAIKQIISVNSQALATGPFEPEGVSPLPVVAQRMNKLLAFDAAGNPVASNFTLAQLEQQPALAQEAAAAAAASALTSAGWASDAAASALAASNSASAAATSASNALTSETNAAATLSTAQKQLQTISATVAANALTLGWTKTPISFRSATLSSGVVNNRNPGANLSLVVPSGATLGTASGVPSRLALLLLDNAGTVELAVCNLAGGLNLDEAGLISTTAISSSANAANVVYSTTARSSVPYRLVGTFDSTQASAGAWAATGIVQGAGGQAQAALGSLGSGQTWQNLTGSRALSTTYTNTTGRPIAIFVVGSGISAANMTVTVSGANLGGPSIGPNAFAQALFMIIPVGATYSVAYNSTFTIWSELR